MGITGVMVRSVFSRNRSFGTHESKARSKAEDKRRWSAVRSYLCGDEFNSVLAEEDSASVKSSEATVTQPIHEDSVEKGDVLIEETKEAVVPEEKQNATSKLFRQEDAAIIIQSAFRKFLARRQSEEIKSRDDKQEVSLVLESPGRDSVGTSIEVQTGNSVEVLSVREEDVAVHCRMQKKSRTQVLKLKEDWDDSTVSSNISKMRIQNRMEATNRRERALAYAFAQQLRICSKKKQTRSDDTQPNVSWSWLERWMATRVPECSIQSCTGKQLEPTSNSQGLAMGKRFLDLAVEEKESCGSNEVSVQFDSLSVTTMSDKDSFKPTRSRLKATRTISRRKTVPSYQFPKENNKVRALQEQSSSNRSVLQPPNTFLQHNEQVVEKEISKEGEQDTEHKAKQPGIKKETKSQDASALQQHAL